MAKLTAAQQRFIELELKRDDYEKFKKELADATAAVVAESGLDVMFQDEQGTVYKIVEPRGRWVEYEKLSYVRTKRYGEPKGSLSIKEAEAAGFIVKI